MDDSGIKPMQPPDLYAAIERRLQEAPDLEHPTAAPLVLSTWHPNIVSASCRLVVLVYEL
jgi:hypothetical protein